MKLSRRGTVCREDTDIGQHIRFLLLCNRSPQIQLLKTTHLLSVPVYESEVWVQLGSLPRVSQGCKKVVRQSHILARALTGKGSACKASQVGGRIHFLVAVRFMASCVFKTSIRRLGKMCATLLGDCVNVSRAFHCCILLVSSKSQIVPLIQGRGKLPKDVPAGGRDRGGFLKVYLSILGLDPEFPRLAFASSSFQNLGRTSFLVFSLCL